MKKIIFLFFSCLFLQDIWAQKLRKEQFQNPPQSARPRVWWHWMNGNITKEGIKADLDWMKSIGLGGVQHFDANLGTPQIVAAESMTTGFDAFGFDPERLKRTADLEMASGVNRFVIHTSVHQPFVDSHKPGLSLGTVGQWFTRNETWAKEAKVWVDYLSRSSYLLQQGRNVADLLYLYGENQNITWLTKDKLPTIPQGYEFDFVNASALKEAIQVKEEKLFSKNGNAYQILVLDSTAKAMTLSTLQRVETLLNKGAKVTGTIPEYSPSLSDNIHEFELIRQRVMLHANFLKGDLKKILSQMKVSPDVESDDLSLRFRHRTHNQQEIFWVSHRSDTPMKVKLQLRVSGKIPQLWNPVTGEIQQLTFSIQGGKTYLTLDMTSWDAQFIIFDQPTSLKTLTLKELKPQKVLTINSEWSLELGTQKITLDSLYSWTERKENDLKYFSGRGIYETTFDLNSVNPKNNYWIDLGQVHEIAEVFLNGKSQGIVWKKPYLVTLNGLKSGGNHLKIAVTNLWVNRLIGDAGLPDAQKSTFTLFPFYQSSDSLLSSGLLSEVSIWKK